MTGFLSLRALLAGVLLLAAFLLAGCGPAAPETAPEDTATPAPPGGTPFRSPAEQRRVEPLLLPTRTPVGGGSLRTALPGAVVRENGSGGGDGAAQSSGEGEEPGSGAPLPQVHIPGHTPGPTEYVPSEEDRLDALALTAVPCVDDFRQTLLNYEGPEEFGPEVAERLSEEFKARRADCAALGWSPGFPRDTAGRSRGGRACHRQYEFRKSPDVPLGRGSRVPSVFKREVAGTQVLRPSTLISYEKLDGSRSIPVALIHLDPLPFNPDAAGCWYTWAGSGWYWHEFIPGVWSEMGFDPARFPECERLLRTVLSELRSGGEVLDVDGVAAAKEKAVLALPEECSGGAEGNRPGRYWKLFPQAASQPGCAVEAPTGVMPDGSLVVNWHDSYPDAFGGSACWVLSPEGEWSFHPASEE